MGKKKKSINSFVFAARFAVSVGDFSYLIILKRLDKWL